jgi:phosphoserine phosphatase
MRAESDWARVVGVGRIQDKTRWTKALGEAVTVVYGDCIEDVDLSKHSGAGGHETTMRHLS